MTSTVGTKPVRSRLGLLGRAAALAAVAGIAVFAAQGPPKPAHALFHFAVIDEAMFGYGADPSIQYVEIKMLSAGQNLSAHAILGYFNTDGSYGGDILEVPANAPTGVANGRYLLASTGFAAAAGITPEFTFAPVTLPAAGMICYGAPGILPPNPPTWPRTVMTNWIDCVPYGGYIGPPIKGGPATPFGLGDGTSSLTRVSDLDNASVDFVLACPSPQANTAAVGFNHDNHINLPPSFPFDDLTFPNSDLIGDGCGDTDDDNDGLTDAEELSLPSAACPAATAATDPLKADSDGDRFVDGAECDVSPGFDPASSASKPALAACGSAGDADGDKILSRTEVCNYNSDPNNIDTDGDMAVAGAKDGCEIASVNNDRVVNIADRGIIASAVGSSSSPQYNVLFDLTKDGTINIADTGLAASLNGLCP